MWDRLISLDEVVNMTKIRGPKETMEHYRMYLHSREAERLAQALRKEGYPTEAYEFPHAMGVWNAPHRSGLLNKHHATKRAVEQIRKRGQPKISSPKGFRQVLPLISKDIFKNAKLQPWGTNIPGVLRQYEHSPSLAVLDWIKHDKACKEIRDIGISQGDFPNAPLNLYLTLNGTPSVRARKKTKQLIQMIGEDLGIEDCFSPENFLGKILPRVTIPTFEKYSLNFWGTKAIKMLDNAYKGSNIKAVYDLVNQDPDLRRVKDFGLRKDHFSYVPEWMTSRKEPTALTYQVTKLFIENLANSLGVDYRTTEGWLEMLPYFKRENYRDMVLEKESGNTVYNLYCNYKMPHIIMKLINRDDEFSEVRPWMRREFLSRPSHYRRAHAEAHIQSLDERAE
ncbi:MAG: hypothetical protein ABIH34_05140 [Nanoarchaeota archaeon]